MTARAPERIPQRGPRPAAPPPPDLRIVGSPRTRRRAGRAVLALALLVMFGALLMSAVVHTILVSGQQRLDRMDQRVERDQQRLARMRLKVALLSSPQRVVAAAQAEGMVVPDRVIWLTPGRGSSTAPFAPAPVPPTTSPAPPPTSTPRAGQGGSELAGRPTGDGTAGRSPDTSPAR